MSEFTKVSEIALEAYRRPVIKIQRAGAVIPMFYFPPKNFKKYSMGLI